MLAVDELGEKTNSTPAVAGGELFLRNARYVPPELPLLEGPEGSEGAVAQLHQRCELVWPDPAGAMCIPKVFAHLRQ